jgi:hypothetical protein
MGKRELLKTAVKAARLGGGYLLLSIEHPAIISRGAP